MSAPSAAPPKKRKKPVEQVAHKVALVGFTKSREDAPWGDPEWTVAGCNNLHRQPGMDGLWQQANAWYDLHNLRTVLEDEVHVDWLRAGHMPCFVSPGVAQADWPATLEFPYHEIIAWAESHNLAGARYFTNSVSWMVAHAHMLLEHAGFDQGRGGEIGMWGIDMAVGGEGQTEYSSQRPSCEYWLGFAEGRGIKVTVSERSDLLKCGSLYGLEDSSPLMRKMADREAEMVAQIAGIHQQRAQLEQQLGQLAAHENQCYGALQDTRYYRGVWLMPEGTRKGGDDPFSTSQPSEAQPAGV